MKLLRCTITALIFIVLSAGAAFADIMEDGASVTGTAQPRTIGRSVEGRRIEAYHFGGGPHTVVIFAGIHGGYEWNTVALARQLIRRFDADPQFIPDGINVYVIPVLNPDGLARITGGKPLSEVDFSSKNLPPGRFNAHGVDLNRNFDYQWEPASYWGTTRVDAGARPFSEPETRALRDFVTEVEPALVISYHSAANGIYYGGKRESWEPGRTFARAYSNASGYPLPEGGGLVNYRITGAAANYFYSRGVPAVTVELSGRSGPELSRNIDGLREVFKTAASR